MGLALKDVFAEHSDTLGIGVGVEVVTSLDKDILELLVWVVSVAGPYVSLLASHSQLVMIPSTHVSENRRLERDETHCEPS